TSRNPAGSRTHSELCLRHQSIRRRMQRPSNATSWYNFLDDGWLGVTRDQIGRLMTVALIGSCPIVPGNADQCSTKSRMIEIRTAHAGCFFQPHQLAAAVSDLQPDRIDELRGRP